MSKILFQNLDNLARYANRTEALSIIEAGMNSIDTDKVISSSISITEELLQIKDFKIDLKKIKKIRVIGFGKASCQAALSLEKILGSKINDGIVIDIKTVKCEYITSLLGTHPKPSPQNTEATKHIFTLAKDINENDLVLVIVSGGGSSLLCSSEEECSQGDKLYDDFVRVGGNIQELNTVRKHLSSLKGGGLAKLLYPATVVGLIFCDVPGASYEETASSPTYKDKTSIKDAETVLNKYNLKDYNLNETPKEDMYFEKVKNILLVSNMIALEAMSEKAKALGFETKILSANIYSTPEETVHDFTKILTKKSVILGGGEIKLKVKGSGGVGGRCTHLALEAIPYLEDDDIFIAIASDGIDNSSAAGAIVDKNTLKKLAELKLDRENYLSRYDSYNFFKKTDDLIITGQTESNVADLMLWLRQ